MNLGNISRKTGMNRKISTDTGIQDTEAEKEKKVFDKFIDD